MSVFIVNSMRFTDEARYRAYEAAFPKVFAQFKGRVLAADEAPLPLTPDFKYDKVVILEFPSKADAIAFIKSDAYQAISPDREAGTQSDIAIVNKFEYPAVV